jgi:hypothetical protein
MKRVVLLIVACIIVSFVFVNVAGAEKAKTFRATGKVTAIDSDGIGIVISTMAGGKELVVGTIIDKDTMGKKAGKKITLDQIKVGDTVTLVYVRTDDLHAKEILKK